MKKKLEAELISIAHRILKLKGKSEIEQLQIETLKLYEKLSVLKFVEVHFGEQQPTIGKSDFIEKLEIDSNVDKIVEPIEFVENEIKKEKILLIEEVETEQKTTSEFSFDDILGKNYGDIEFVKPNEIKPTAELENVNETMTDESFEVEVPSETVDISVEETVPLELEIEDEPIFETPILESISTTSAPDKAIFGINFGLNDRIGFVNHLFDGSSEDMNRVVSQLSTFDSFEEAKDFIEQIVKPDYNNWEGKEVYSERFLEVIAQNFK